MHKGNGIVMKKLINRELFPTRLEDPLTVVDIGSYDVNGTLKRFMPPKWKYIGLDIVPGPNVDRIIEDVYTFPVEDDSIDLVVSSDCFLYVRNPFKLMESTYKCLKPGGVVIICASYEARIGIMGHSEEISPYNDVEYDCWRILKYGMLALLEDSGFKVIKAEYRTEWTWGIGVKE